MVGSSGILAPLGAMLRLRSHRTIGISRGGRLRVGDWDDRVALDTHDLVATLAWTDQLGAGIAVLIGYSPALTAATWPVLARDTARTLVVATSEHAAPHAPEPPWAGLPRVAVLQLGWVAGRTRRWHSPTEISRGVARVLTDAVPHRVLGTVRPWADRPG